MHKTPTSPRRRSLLAAAGAAAGAAAVWTGFAASGAPWAAFVGAGAWARGGSINAGAAGGNVSSE